MSPTAIGFFLIFLALVGEEVYPLPRPPPTPSRPCVASPLETAAVFTVVTIFLFILFMV